MTLVNITLTEDEQDFLLVLAGKADDTVKVIRPVIAIGIADKIRTARDDTRWEVYPPNDEDGHQRKAAHEQAQATAQDHGSET